MSGGNERRTAVPHLLALVALVGAGCVDVPGATPAGLAARETRAYVANFGGDDVSVVRATDHTVLGEIEVGAGPQAIATTPDGTFAYVVHNILFPTSDDAAISVIRTADGEVITQIPYQPAQLLNVPKVTPDGAYVYVTNGRYVAENPDTHVLVLRTFDNTIVDRVDAGPHSDIAIAPNGAFAYLTVQPLGLLNVVRLEDNTVVASIPVAPRPIRVTITPDSAHAYVTHGESDIVTRIRTSDHSVVETFDVAGSLGLEVTPDGEHVYFACRAGSDPGNVTVLRTSDHGVEASIPVGVQPQFVAFTSDGALAYVTNMLSDTVSVIDTAALAVIATVAVGTRPVGIAFAEVSVATPDAEIEDARDSIDELEAAGTLNHGQATALRAHLENARRLLERGQTHAARAQIEAFMSQVTDLHDAGVLTDAEAAALMAAAHRVLAGIEA